MQGVNSILFHCPNRSFWLFYIGIHGSRVEIAVSKETLWLDDKDD